MFAMVLAGCGRLGFDGLAPLDDGARERLHTLLATFTEGHDTAALRAANAALQRRP